VDMLGDEVAFSHRVLQREPKIGSGSARGPRPS
jgi:hypothetical protein